MFPFACRNTEHKFFRKPLCITFYGLIQSAGRNLIQRRKVEVEHYAQAADFVDFILDNSNFHCSGCEGLGGFDYWAIFCL